MSSHTCCSQSKRSRLGGLEVIVGPVFSGKTEELMRRICRAEWSKKTAMSFYHRLGQKKKKSFLTTHSGLEMVAHVIDSGQGGMSRLLSTACVPVDIISIDEVHFFDDTIINVINTLITSGKLVVVSGLNLDFKGMPFGCVPKLLALADKITKLKSVCSLCTSQAVFSQRISAGVPSSESDPAVFAGQGESVYYEARCRLCFISPPYLKNRAIENIVDAEEGKGLA